MRFDGYGHMRLSGFPSDWLAVTNDWRGPMRLWGFSTLPARRGKHETTHTLTRSHL